MNLCANLHAIEPLITFQECTHGDPPSLQCTEKLHVSLPLSYMDHPGPVSFTIREVDGRVLEKPVEVRVQQIATKFIYPLSHLHTVPYHPVEEVIPVQNAVMGIQKCIDDADAEEPTCGWAFSNGRRIEDSQGFCCNKGTNMLTDKSTWRGEAALNRQSTVWDSFSTAHCYRPGEIFYSGFEISTPIVADGIQVRMTVGDLSKEFTLSHADSIYQSIVGQQLFIVGRTLNISGRASYEPGSWDGPAHLDDFVLYLPSSPAEHPFTEDILGHTMLVGRDQIDVSGKTCDKIGIDYEGFRYQPGRAQLAIQGHDIVGTHEISGEKTKRSAQISTDVIAEKIEDRPIPYGSVCSTTKAGDCLHNQLYHKHQNDMQVLAANSQENTQHLIAGMKIFEDAIFSIDQTKFEYWNEAMRRAQVVLEIDARDVFPSASLPIQIDPPVGPIKPKQ
jgi:hypothetical protein